MGKIAHLNKGLDNIRTKLQQADSVGANIGNLLDGKFEKVNMNLERSLNTLVAQSNQSQNVAFSNAVTQAVSNVTQSQTILLNALTRISTDLLNSHKSLAKEVGSVQVGVGSTQNSIVKQLSDLDKRLSRSIDRLPTQFPEQKEVDFSAVSRDLKDLHSAIKTIHIPKPPKVPDVAPALKSLEKRIDNREHVFEVERDPFTDLITNINVRVK